MADDTESKPAEIGDELEDTSELDHKLEVKSVEVGEKLDESSECPEEVPEMPKLNGIDTEATENEGERFKRKAEDENSYTEETEPHFKKQKTDISAVNDSLVQDEMIETLQKTEIEEKDKVESKEEKQVESSEAEKVESNGEEKVESNDEGKIESNKEEKVELNEEEKGQSNGEERVESNGEEKVESNGEEKVESSGEEKLESSGEEKLESSGEENLESSGEEKLESNGDEKVESSGEEKVESNKEEKIELNREETVELDEDKVELGDGETSEGKDIQNENQKKHVELKVPVVKTAELNNMGDSNVLNLSKKPAEVFENKQNIKINGKQEVLKRTDSPMDLSKVVDLSRQSKAQIGPDEDVIMLSDEENELPKLVNGFAEVTTGQLYTAKKVIKKLQEDLRNEESKLVLLKKIRQSQVVNHLPDTNSNSVQSKPTGQVPQASSRPQQGNSKSNQQPAHVHTNKPSSVTSHQSQRPTQQPAHANHATHNRHSGSVQNSSSPHPSQVQRSGSSSHVSQYSRQQPSQAASKPSQPEQTPAQRQAAAKLALRKQLEKTLLQIPPPKPPPPEMNFIPSSGSGDFVPLVGLEEVVKFIVEVDARIKGGKSAEVKYVFNPFTCVQCGTDFTPVWKRDKPGSKNVICEQCVTSNQKKALKQEHTNRLKSAFVKALQQEQEIEQRMQQAEKQSAASSSHSSSSSSHQHSTTHSQHHQQQQQHHSSSSQKQSGSSSHHHHSTQPSPAHSSSHSSSSSSRNTHSSTTSAGSSSSSSSYKATQEQLRQHQNLLQAHQQQQLRSLGLTSLQNFPHLAFPFQPQLTAKQAAELQRQYLLDMIQPRSVPGNMWRK